MAKTTTAQKDLLSRVTTLGNEALHKLTDIPGGSRVVELANESKTRLDEMQKKLRGLDALEKRVAKLERQLAATAAKKPATSAARKATSAAKSTASAAKKTTTSSRSSGARRSTPKKT